MQTYNHYSFRPSVEINTALGELPTAEKLEIQTLSGESISDYRTIKVTMADGSTRFVHCPSDRYFLKQHKDAFRPIIEGLTLAGKHDFKFITISTPEKASMQVYATGQGYDSVSIGISVTNSYDGSKALSYGFNLFSEKSTIELVGYRQVCNNGMKMRVPLNEAEFVTPEMKTKIKELTSKYMVIRHTSTMDQKIQIMQYLTEALALLQKPVELMIQKAQNWTITDSDKLDQYLKQFIGKRFESKVREQYQNEEKTLWGLYNAVTHVASHDTELKESARSVLLDAGADLLENCLTASAV